MQKKNKITTKDFIERSRKIHGDKYDYSEVEYINSETPVKIYCKNCKKYFMQKPCKHLKGQGCRSCSYNKLTQEEFINKVRKIHGNKYDFSKTIYKGMNNPVTFFCKKCNKYVTTLAASLARGCGCRECSNKENGQKSKLTKTQFIKRVKKIYKQEFKYLNLDDIKDFHSKVILEIQCPVCGKVFKHTPNNHLRKTGCPFCNDTTISFEEFLKRAEELYGNDYEYFKDTYKNFTTETKMYCKKHDLIFYATPHNHCRHRGCPKCHTHSFGELEIQKFLDKYNIRYITQYRFKDCKYKNTLPFDFYLPDYNICIEFQGKQHYEEGTIFDRIESDFKERLERDQIKRDYCKQNNIILFEIRFDEEQETALNNILKFIKVREE